MRSAAGLGLNRLFITTRQMERKRLNLTLRTELHEQLGRLARRYGFKNSCALAVCILRLMASQLEVRADRGTEAADDADVIGDAFAQLGDWERTKHKYGEYGEGQGL